MFRMNKKVEYALMALKHMSEKTPGELTSAKEICESYKSPFDATSRALQIMTQNQILKSEHGAHGGYMIQKDLAKVSLLDLTEMILGTQQIAACLCEEDACDLSEKCNIVTPIENLNDRIKSFYNAISLKEILITTDAGKKSKNAGFTTITV